MSIFSQGKEDDGESRGLLLRQDVIIEHVPLPARVLLPHLLGECGSVRSLCPSIASRFGTSQGGGLAAFSLAQPSRRLSSLLAPPRILEREREAEKGRRLSLGRTWVGGGCCSLRKVRSLFLSLYLHSQVWRRRGPPPARVSLGLPIDEGRRRRGGGGLRRSSP